ncbi:MAG: hypothetical protein ACOX5G_11715 [Kiritimatiellia bacterium]|jgi:hypothetical protein
MKTQIILCSILLFGAASIFAEKSDDWLKERLIAFFYADQGDPWKEFDDFVDRSAITNEQIHRSLMSLFREAEMKLSELASETEEWRYYKAIEIGVVRWLPKCEEFPVKDFLLEVAADKSKDGFLRTIAIGSYLRVADAEEARDVLLQFLAGDRCGIDPLSVYSHAAEVYDQTPPENEAKRRAIIAALMVAAAREEGKIGFVEVDRILAMRSDTYRRSGERLALLEHHSLEPPTRNLYTDADLKAALAESRRYRNHTSVNTNAALLQALDFSRERAADDAGTWGGKLVTPSPEVIFAPRGVQPDAAAPRVRSERRRIVGVGGLAVVAAVSVLFILHRRARGKCPHRKTRRRS